MRSFERCLPTLHHHVFRHYPDADFYVSTIKDADAPKVELLRKAYPSSMIVTETVDAQPVLPLPPGCPPEESWQHGAPFMWEPYAISVPPQAVLRQLWQLQRVWGLYDKGYPADVVIRCRPDLWFHSFEKPFTGASDMAQTPWWGRFGGINDRFAVMGHNAARAYFNTYAILPELITDGVPLHPESLVNSSIARSGCMVTRRLRAEFSSLRNDGEMRPPEITAIDIAHATR